MKSIILTPNGTVDEYIYIKETKTYIIKEEAISITLPLEQEDVTIIAKNNVSIFCGNSVKIICDNSCTINCMNNCTINCNDYCKIHGENLIIVNCNNACSIDVKNKSKVSCQNNCKVNATSCCTIAMNNDNDIYCEDECNLVGNIKNNINAGKTGMISLNSSNIVKIKDNTFLRIGGESNITAIGDNIIIECISSYPYNIFNDITNGLIVTPRKTYKTNKLTQGEIHVNKGKIKREYRVNTLEE